MSCKMSKSEKVAQTILSGAFLTAPQTGLSALLSHPHRQPRHRRSHKDRRTESDFAEEEQRIRLAGSNLKDSA